MGSMANQRDGYFQVQRTVQAEVGLRDISDIRAVQGAQVNELASAAQGEVAQWAAPYPTFTLNRLRSLSLACAGACPDEKVSVVACAVKAAVLLFAIDDIADGTKVVPRDDEADSLLAACADLARTAGRLDLQERVASLIPGLSPEMNTPWCECCQAFKRYCTELSAMPRADLYYPFFARIFADTMSGMRTELTARRAFIETGAVPDYDAYLMAGKRSIGSPALLASLLVAMAPAMVEFELCTCAESLDVFLSAGASCLRLANDVRSFTRETEIEQRPNSVLVLMRARGLSEQEAEKWVVSQADVHLAEMRSLAGTLPPALQVWAERAERFTSVVRDWYMVRELHE